MDILNSNIIVKLLSFSYFFENNNEKTKKRFSKKFFKKSFFLFCIFYLTVFCDFAIFCHLTILRALTVFCHLTKKDNNYKLNLNFNLKGVSMNKHFSKRKKLSEYSGIELSFALCFILVFIFLTIDFLKGTDNVVTRSIFSCFCACYTFLLYSKKNSKFFLIASIFFTLSCLVYLFEYIKVSFGLLF